MSRTRKQTEAASRPKRARKGKVAREDFGELIEISGHTVRRPKARHWVQVNE